MVLDALSARCVHREMSEDAYPIVAVFSGDGLNGFVEFVGICMC